jgi:hypothetical protein
MRTNFATGVGRPTIEPDSAVYDLAFSLESARLG